MQMTGADLARGFHHDVVGPLLQRELPSLRYAAGRLGSGSDVLGLDDAMSRDHDWGCRLTLLVETADRAVLPRLGELLEQNLPEQYRELPVRFPTTWDPSTSHKVELATVTDFAASRLGVNPRPKLSAVDWLTLTGQSVLEVIAGPIFVDTTSEMAVMRAQLNWYPPDVERYVLAAGWQRIAHQLPWVGRTAERGQHVQSRLRSAALVGDLMRLAFPLHQRWAPYCKWLELMFDTLPTADRLADPFHVAVTANGWVEREEALAAAARVLLNVQRDRGFSTPVEGVVAFWDRPYQTIDPAVSQRLLASITDPEVVPLPSGIGSIEQWVDNIDVLARPQRRGAVVEAYRSWMDPNAPSCRL